MPTAGPLYALTLGQSRVETTAEDIYNHAVSISGSNPARAAKFFDLAAEPAPLWIAEDYGSAHGPTGINTVLTACGIAGTVPQFTMYSIEGRDGGSFSSGGSVSHVAYKAFADACATAVAGRTCIWVIEPDAIPKMYAMSGGVNGSEANQRKDSIEYCVNALRAQGSNVRIYLNVGNSNFRSASEIVGILPDCGITAADGVSLNVAQTELFQNEHDYFIELQTLLPAVDGYVINTGLNGRGPYVKQTGDRSNVVFINPPPYGFLDGTGGKPNRPTMGVSIGARPTTKMDVTDYPGLHAILWTKFPGGSDGGNPTPGQVPENVSVVAPDPGDLYPDYLELVYDAAAGLDFSEYEPFALDDGEPPGDPGDPVDITWMGADVLMLGDQNRARSSYSAIEVLSPLEEQARTSWVGIETLMWGDINRARSSWMSIDLLFSSETPQAQILDTSIEIHAAIDLQTNLSLTGTYTEPSIPGWQWDRRRLEDSRWNYAQYLTSLGGHSVGLYDGTKKIWWQSGTVQGCSYLKTDHQFIADQQTWTPVVEIGEYSLQFDNRLLYSDYSTSGFFQEQDSLMKHVLHEDAVWTSVQVALYKRDQLFNIRKYLDFKYVDEFSGEINETSHTRLDTTDEQGNILVENLSTRKAEFLITEDNSVLLNGIHKVSNAFTRSTEFPDAPPSEWIESAGANQAQGRAVLSEYLPVQSGSMRVWVDTGSSLTELPRVNSLAFVDPTLSCFEVDEDLGLVLTSGFKAPDLTLLEPLSLDGDEIAVYPETVSIDQYPQQGVLVLDGEEIAYSERTNRRFSNLVRGYNGTTPAAHAQGITVAHRRMGASFAGSLYLEYTAVPRIDYEVSPWNKRTANTARSWLDTKPLSNVETTNLLQIHPGDISLDSIVLTTDSVKIGGDLYGPVFYGSDVSALTATGFDLNGNPVQDVQLTIGITNGTGYLNGVPGQYTDLSNTLGQIYADYNHPMNRDDFEFRVTETEHVGADTVMTIPGLKEGTTPDEITVLQVLKHDKIVGTVGTPLEILAHGVASAPYGAYRIDLDGLVGQEMRGGIVHVVISGFRYYREITWVEQLRDPDDVLFTRVYLKSVLPGNPNGQLAYLLESQATEWEPALLNGSRYVLYEWSEEVLHPLTNEIGAYAPLHPDEVDTAASTVKFFNRQLPIPQPNAVANNLGAYIVIAPGEVSLQAWGTDPLTGRVITSNTIRLNLELASFFTGVDKSGVLPIPHGWKLPDGDESNVGSGIGGSNFISINNAASFTQAAFQLNL